MVEPPESEPVSIMEGARASPGGSVGTPFVKNHRGAVVLVPEAPDDNCPQGLAARGDLAPHDVEGLCGSESVRGTGTKAALGGAGSGIIETYADVPSEVPSI